jgi:hypothetical protein
MNKHIELYKYGSFLAGRSLAIDIINGEKITEETEAVLVDFGGVKGVAQSFLSELFMYFRRLQIKKVDWVNVNDEVIQAKIQMEYSKFKKYDFLNGKANHDPK